MNKKNSPKGKRSPKGKGRKDYDAKDKYEKNKDKEAFGNDISWYVNNPQMLIDACNLSFANVLAKPILYSDGTIGDVAYTWDLDCPGIMSIEVLPTIGSVLRNASQYQTGDQWDSAVNMAARAEWSFIRQKNAGAKNYDAPDLMMYHLAMDNIYMYWSWMVRAYGYLRLFSFKNKYYPYGLLRSMGLNDAAIENLRANMADFRTYINLYAAQMSSFAVPINLPYVKRHLWLFQNAFTDSSTTKAQVYVYNPTGFYQLNEVTEEPLFLEFVGKPDFTAPSTATARKAPWSVTAFQNFGDSLLSQIVKSESCNIMSGDILKAYEAGGIYGFQSIPDDFSLVPVYDETVLSQIHNANFTVVNTALESYILQDPAIDAGYIYQTIEAGAAGEKAVIIDSRFETPTPTDVMYATRLTAVQDVENPWYINCGSELATGFKVWYDTTDYTKYIAYGSDQDGGAIYTVNFRGYDGTVNGEDDIYVKLSDVQKFQRFISILSKFDWHPLIQMRSRYQNAGADADDILADLYGDVDNFAIAQAQTISKMHRVALNSEFGLPYTLTSIK